MRKISLVDKIFNFSDTKTFEILAIELCKYQSVNNPVYREYLKNLKFNAKKVKNLYQIPFLPVQFFKTHKVVCGKRQRDGTVFTSSGTTGNVKSKHYVPDIGLYEECLRKGFEYFYGNIRNYCIWALLPSRSKSSSLIYMINDLIAQSKHPDSGFYDNIEELAEKLIRAEKKKQKVLLFGVSYALLDLCGHNEVLKIRELANKNLIVMETGGMKGRRKEMVREELHKILCDKLGVAQIHSEYGMTELLSQAYSKGNGFFKPPPWMKVIIRDINDPLTLTGNNKTGGINIVDLANINSCAFIATQDLGRTHSDGSFEVLGRFDNSDIRGCNLLMGN